MLGVFARPVNGQVTKCLESLHETTLSNVPGYPTKEDTWGVCGVLVTTWRKLSTPCADNIRTWSRTVREGEKWVRSEQH